MPYFQLVSCKIKFQLLVGYFPDGRARTRTFGVGPVRADVSADDVAAVARAIAPLLAYPVICVRVVRKYVLSRTASQPLTRLNPTIFHSYAAQHAVDGMTRALYYFPIGGQIVRRTLERNRE